MKLNKLKLGSAIAAITLAGGIALPLVSNSVGTNTIKTNHINNIDIDANKNNSSTNLQVVNSIDDVAIENVNLDGQSGYVVLKNNDIREVYVWGWNTNGQLGVGDTDDKPTPTKITLPVIDADTVIKSISINDNSSHALLEKNGVQELYVWGKNEHGELGLGHENALNVPTPFPLSIFGNGVLREIVFNYYNSYAIIDKANGQTDIYVWGANDHGQLGLGTLDKQSTPVLLPLSTTMYGANLQNVQISDKSQGSSAYALYELNGVSQLYVWGRNTNNQLGLDNNKIDVSTPQLIPSSRFNDGKIISFRFEHEYMSWALVNVDGVKRLYTCGANAFGQLGLFDPSSHPTIPVHTAILSSVFDSGEIVDVGSYGNTGINMYAMVNVNGTLQMYTWGENRDGQVGNNARQDTVWTPYKIPTTAFNGGTIKSYSFGQYNVMVVAKVGNVEQVFVWGFNDLGFLGLGNSQPTPVPTRIENPLFHGATITLPTRTRIDNTIFSLQKDGKTSHYISGWNEFGQLGDGTIVTKYTHTPILSTVFTRLSTKESEKTAILKANVSATDAMQSIISSDIQVRTSLEKYVDLSSFPLGAKLSIDADKTKINYEQGTINLVVNTTSYYPPFVAIPVEENKQFSIEITGFRPIKDFPIIAKTAPTLNAIEFYDFVIASDKTNRMFLEQYLDLSCIPLDAEIVIEPLKTTDSNKIEFILKTNKVYKNNGTATLGNYEQLFSFNLDPNNNHIKNDDSTPGWLNSTVIIGLIIGGCVLAAIILTSIYALTHKTKYY